jgi:DNA-binding NarL/FixJ family response regulator
VYCYYTCAAACEAIAHIHPPDIVLLDIHFPDENGLDAIPIIRTRAPQTKIVIQSFDEEREMVITAARCHVDGYVLKTDSFDVVLHACLRALRGEVLFDPAVVPHLLDAVAEKHEFHHQHGLTVTEHKLLQHIAYGFSADWISKKEYMSKQTVYTTCATYTESLEQSPTPNLLQKYTASGSYSF